MSIDNVTTNAALGLGAALVLLIAAGWRKPARAAERLRRGDATQFADGEDRSVPDGGVVAGADMQVVDQAEVYRSPSLLRRIGALFASVGMAVVLGAIAATLIGYASAMAVIELTALLKR